MKKVQSIVIIVVVALVLGGVLYLLAYYSPLFLRSPQLGFWKWGLYRQEIVELVTEDTISFTDQAESLRLVFDVEDPVLYKRMEDYQAYLEGFVSKYFDMIHLTLFYDNEKHEIDLFNLQSAFQTYYNFGDGIQVEIPAPYFAEGVQVSDPSRLARVRWPKEVRYRIVLDEPLEGTALYVVAGDAAGVSTP